MRVVCCICSAVLNEPGALVFSPPSWPFDTVDKFHVCERCWITKVRPFIIDGPGH